jgi:transcription-repair coupling factor (superfamily II helicase)
LPRSLLTVGEARRRISAIKQYSELGAGFKIAMRDLEIRGAGNLLGTAQSGHIIAIGFDLYCRMLRQAVQRLTGGGGPPPTAALQLDFVAFTEGEFVGSEESLAPAFLPVAYIPEAEARIEAYRKFHEALTEAQLAEVEAEWRDRYGPPAAAAAILLLTARIRLAAGACGITAIETRGPKLMLTRRGDYLLIGHKFPRLEAADPAERLQELHHMLLALDLPRRS